MCCSQDTNRSPETLCLPVSLLCGCDSGNNRVNFLTDAIGGTPDDLLTYPGYALLSLPDVIGPRYYFLARHPGWLDAFSQPATGCLQLARVMGPDTPAFLDDVAQVCTGH